MGVAEGGVSEKAIFVTSYSKTDGGRAVCYQLC